MKQLALSRKLVPSLPCLSWCARLKLSDATVLVYHGRSVETDENSFCEGAWTSDFSRRDFINASFFTGSGGRLTNHGLEFATPMHTLAPIYLYETSSELIISNSLPFLLSQAGDDLALDYKFYAYDFTSVIRGIRKYIDRVPTRDGKSVRLFYHSNIEITRNGEIKTRAKPVPPAFKSYKDYYGFLNEQVGALARNAGDPLRKVRYEPITTTSSGYDSPACSVLAKEFGCRQAITFKTSQKGEDDSGKEIARKLGLEVLEYGRKDYRDCAEGAEAEFLAGGMNGGDMILAPLANVLRGKLLFSGFHGDKIWNRENEKVGPEIIRGDTSGSALHEFRLRVGFLNLPLPFVGCCRHEDIHRISNSPEMKPWATMDPEYDRPIPRRILQDAGVPGRLFGQAKKAAGSSFLAGERDPSCTRDVLSPESFNDFTQFANKIRFFGSSWERMYLALMRTLFRTNHSLLKRCQKIGFFQNAQVVVPERFRQRTIKNHLVFQWAMSKVKDRYQVAESDDLAVAPDHPIQDRHPKTPARERSTKMISMAAR